MQDVKWPGAHVHILKEAAELRPFHLFKGLITSDNPFCHISFESLSVEFLFLVIWSV
jgi:hypothetical protein